SSDVCSSDLNGISALNQVCLTVAQQGFALGSGGFSVLDIWGIPAIFFSQGFHNLSSDFCLSARVGSVAFTQADARLVEFHAESDIARFDGNQKTTICFVGRGASSE